MDKQGLPTGTKPPPSKKKKSEEAILAQKAYDKERDKTRIYLLHIYNRWQKLKEQKNYKKDWELALFLLKW